MVSSFLCLERLIGISIKKVPNYKVNKKDLDQRLVRVSVMEFKSFLISIKDAVHMINKVFRLQKRYSEILCSVSI